MKPSTSTLAFGLLLSVAAPCSAALAVDPGAQILLERANFWRVQQRYDLATHGDGDRGQLQRSVRRQHTSVDILREHLCRRDLRQ